MLEWQVVFISGFFSGWIARALAILIYNKVSKQEKEK